VAQGVKNGTDGVDLAKPCENVLAATRLLQLFASDDEQ
jgi:hypothetical protein